MMTASNIHYEMSDRIRAISAGGIGAIHLMAQKLGLVQNLNDNLHLLKRHQPYFESDHILSIAHNLLAGGSRIEHLEVRRHDEVYLDALGATRIPDPTTAGDFCRRFGPADVERLMETLKGTRLRVWEHQVDASLDEAFLDADGTLAPTDGWCKQGVDIAYNGTWGYHPLVISLANTAEPLFLASRSGNRPSHKHADGYLDRAIELCRRGGFRRVTLRGDTDFTQTKHLDRWDADGVRFVFGIDARRNLKDRAEDLPPGAFSVLKRPARSQVKTTPRGTRKDPKTPIVVAREYETIRLKGGEVAEFDSRPTACRKAYRVIVLRKRLSREKGQQVLFEDSRTYFYLTNDRTTSAAEVVFLANDRCDQENLIAHLKDAGAMAMPVWDLVSNWAYLVMASLAWSLKAWAALLLPEDGRWGEKYRAEKRSLSRMEFRTFCVALIEVPCQIVRGGRRLLYRLLAWNPWQGVFLRLVERLHSRRLCRGWGSVKPRSVCLGPCWPPMMRGSVVMAERECAVEYWVR